MRVNQSYKVVKCIKCGVEFFFNKKDYSVCQDCLQIVFKELETLADERNKKIKLERDAERKRRLLEARGRSYNKFYKIRELVIDQTFRPLEKAILLDRDCLKCDREFVAKGKFNRLCERCNEQNLNFYRRSREENPIE